MHALRHMARLFVMPAGMSLLMLCGCSSQCPQGTVKDGELCRKSQAENSDTATEVTNGGSAGSDQSSGGMPAIDRVPSVPAGASNSAGAGAVTASVAGAGARLAPAAGVAGMSVAAKAGIPGPSAGGVGGTQAASVATGGVTAVMPACVPSTEECDDADNDCDGKVDEDVSRVCGNAMPPCKQGTQACVNGAWSTDCIGEVKPSPEICDGVDNDCNGTPDETCSCVNGMTQVCGNPTPPCKQGTQTCTDGAWPTDCAGEVKGSAEVCDGLDNDCNGAVDQGGDALCGSGKKCAGTAGCVTCKTANDCEKRMCQNTVCSPAGQCTYSPMNSGSKGGGCSGTMVCDGAGECVECVTSSQCGSFQICTGGSCRDSCGNGVVDTSVGETCDPTATSGKNLNCDPTTCRLGNPYAACEASDTSSCNGGVDGSCGNRYCHPKCDASNPCPAASGFTAACQSGVCVFACTSAAPTPPATSSPDCPSVANYCTLNTVCVRPTT
jgi:hypothetical protein